MGQKADKERERESIHTHTEERQGKARRRTFCTSQPVGALLLLCAPLLFGPLPETQRSERSCLLSTKVTLFWLYSSTLLMYLLKGIRSESILFRERPQNESYKVLPSPTKFLTVGKFNVLRQWGVRNSN